MSTGHVNQAVLLGSKGAVMAQRAVDWTVADAVSLESAVGGQNLFELLGRRWNAVRCDKTAILARCENWHLIVAFGNNTTVIVVSDPGMYPSIAAEAAMCLAAYLQNNQESA